MGSFKSTVMPAKAGTQRARFWVPAFAGMTALLGASVVYAAPAHPANMSREAQVAAVIARYASQPPTLRVLLQTMPKGGDLHNHLDGSVYAEDFLQWASEDA